MRQPHRSHRCRAKAVRQDDPVERAGLPFSISDLDGDGGPEIATVIGRGDSTQLALDSLHVFSASGTELWRRELTDSLMFGSVRFDPPWSTGPLRILRSTRGSEILWLTHHHTWWPSLALRFDGRGALTGRFVHAGWLTSMAGLEDGTVLLGGVSNQHDADVFMVLDAVSWNGRN